MLNSQRLSVAQGSLTHVSMELPKQMKNVCMCGEVYPTRKLTSGGFATIYTTKDKSGVTHALKVINLCLIRVRVVFNVLYSTLFQIHTPLCM